MAARSLNDIRTELQRMQGLIDQLESQIDNAEKELEKQSVPVQERLRLLHDREARLVRLYGKEKALQQELEQRTFVILLQ